MHHWSLPLNPPTMRHLLRNLPDLRLARLQPHQQTCRRCLQQLQPRPYLDLVFLHLLPLMPIKAVIPQNIEDHAKSRRPITTTATEIEIRTMATVRDPLVGDSVKVPTVMILTTIPPTDAGDETNIPAFRIGRSTLASFLELQCFSRLVLDLLLISSVNLDTFCANRLHGKELSREPRILHVFSVRSICLLGVNSLTWFYLSVMAKG